MQASGLGLSVQNMLEEAPSFLQDSTQGPCPMWALPMPTGMTVVTDQTQGKMQTVSRAQS